VAKPDTSTLEATVAAALERFNAKHEARELALAAARAIIRSSANAIRAVHREEFERARRLFAEAQQLNAEMREALALHPDLYYAGFVHDAQKELAEAAATLALATGAPLPTPEEVGVELPAYLNGLGEAIGEARRMILDRLRRGAIEGCEELLRAMDDIYAGLVLFDFPEPLTGNLRRTVDNARGILERTRGDLTMAVVQHRAVESIRSSNPSDPPPA